MPNKRYPASNVANSAVQLARVKKNSAGTITKGQAVYSVGYDAAEDMYLVELAKADSISTMPSVGIAYEDFTNVDPGTLILSGDLFGINTGGFSANQELYVSAATAGALTSTRPTTLTVEKIAIVVYSHATAGIIQVYNYGCDDSPLSSTAPENVTKATASAGSVAEASRRDHKHDITTAAASSLSVGGSNAEGSGTSLARSDHTHSLPAFGSSSGTFCQGNDARLSDARTPASHATSHKSGGGDAIKLDELAAPTDITTLDASTSAHGLAPKLPNNNAKYLDGTGAWTTPAGITAPLSGTAPVNVTKAAASAGVAAEASRQDHKHDITTAVPVNTGTANAEGTSTSLARADHVHGGASVLQSAMAEKSTDATTTSASFVDLLTVTITTIASTVCKIYFTVSASHTTAEAATTFQLLIDGSAVRGLATYQPKFGGGFQCGGALIYRKTGLSAASHTFKIQWKTSGSTAQIRPVTTIAEHASLVVEEIAR